MPDRPNAVLAAHEAHAWMRCPKRERARPVRAPMGAASVTVDEMLVGAIRREPQIGARIRYDEETGDAAALRRASETVVDRFEEWARAEGLEPQKCLQSVGATIDFKDWRVSVRGVVDMIATDDKGLVHILQTSASPRPPDHLLATLAIKCWLVSLDGRDALFGGPPLMGHALWLPRRAGADPWHRGSPFAQLAAYGEHMARAAALDTRQDTPRPNPMCKGCWVGDCLLRR